MADVQPLRAPHYDLVRGGSLDDVAAPPSDAPAPPPTRPARGGRGGLADPSPYNVVRVALPGGEPDPYAEAATIFERWQQEGAVVRDEEPALWTLTQDYTGPD